MEAKFVEAIPRPGVLGISELARYKDDGTRIPEADIDYPFELEFEPNHELAA